MVTVSKVPTDQQCLGWYARVCISFTLDSRGLITLKASHVLGKRVRAHLGNTSQE